MSDSKQIPWTKAVLAAVAVGIIAAGGYLAMNPAQEMKTKKTRPTRISDEKLYAILQKLMQEQRVDPDTIKEVLGAFKTKKPDTYTDDGRLLITQWVGAYHQYEIEQAIRSGVTDSDTLLRIQAKQSPNNEKCWQILEGESTNPAVNNALKDLRCELAHQLKDITKLENALNLRVEDGADALNLQQQMLVFSLCAIVGRWGLMVELGEILEKINPNLMLTLHAEANRTKQPDLSILFEFAKEKLPVIEDKVYCAYIAVEMSRKLVSVETNDADLKARLHEQYSDEFQNVQVISEPIILRQGAYAQILPNPGNQLMGVGPMDSKHCVLKGYIHMDSTTQQEFVTPNESGIYIEERSDLTYESTDEQGIQTWVGTLTTSTCEKKDERVKCVFDTIVKLKQQNL